MAKPNAPISSINEAKKESLPALLDQLMSDFLKGNVDGCLPAVVHSFDDVNNRVTVQPLIRILQSDGAELPRGTLTVPVFNLGSSRMSLHFNLVAGDLGWLKANDRDISLFLQDLTEQRPNTLRKHSFSDAVFYPDSMRGMGLDADATMTNAAGTVKTEWFSDKIVHTAPTVDIVGDLSVSGGITGGTVETDAGISLDDHTHIGSPTAPVGAVSPTGAAQ